MAANSVPVLVASDPLAAFHMVRRWSKSMATLPLFIFLFSANNSALAEKINYSTSPSVTVVFADETETHGLREIFASDGGSLPAIVHGQRCHLVDLEERSVRYLY